MHSLNWREHYLKPFSRGPYLVKEIDSLIQFHIPALYAKIESEGLKEIIMENFYNYTIFSLCCNEHIPIDVTMRIFEVVIFEGLGDVSLVRLILYMLMIMEEDIMQIEDGADRFKYLL